MTVVEEAEKYIGRRITFGEADEWQSATIPNLGVATVVKVFRKVLYPRSPFERPMEVPENVFFLLKLEKPHHIEIPGVEIPVAAQEYLVLELNPDGMDRSFAGVLTLGHLNVLIEERAIEDDVIRIRDTYPLARYPEIEPAH